MHEFLDAVVEMELSFSVSMPIDEPVRQAIVALPESAWAPAVGRRAGDLPQEAPPPGRPAQLHGSRGPPLPGAADRPARRGDLVTLEACHRARAGVEDAIRAAKDTGLRNLPFRAFAPNAVWLELVLMAQDLLVWAQRLLLEGDLARAEPKRLRYRLLHVAGRITRSGRRLRLHLPETWPWAGALAAAFRRLGALPAPG